MGVLYHDAAAEWTVPQDTQRAYLRADATFARPGDGMSYLDGRGDWTGPQMGTPARDLPVGTPGNDTLVEFLRLWGEPIVWRVIGRDLDGMPADSVTLVADKLLAILPFDAKEPNNSDGNRKSYGNNDYTVSNIRQWLNSKEKAGKWYKAQHAADQAPDKAHVNGGYNAYDTWGGFLSESEDQEIATLMDKTRHIGGRSSNGNSCVDKVFLLTSTEVGLGALSGDGTKIPYFADNNSRITNSTPQAFAHGNYPNSLSSADQSWYWWLATSDPGNSYYVRYVHYDGTLNLDQASDGVTAVRPACNIKASARFSPEPNGAGHYTLMGA